MKAKMWELYEELKEIVYVVDMESHELVYANRRAREIYHINAMEDLKGKKCYELLMCSSMPCAVCGSKKLTPGVFMEEVRYSPVIKKKLARKVTVIEEDGKRYRFELAVDLSAWEQQNKGYEDNEVMVNEGLRLSLSVSTPEDSIAVLLEYLGQSLSSERVYIFEETQNGVFDNTYEWCASGVAPQKENLQGVSYQVVSLWYEKFMKDENVVIKNVENLRESDQVVYEYLKPQNIRSLVVSPLVIEGKVIGFYGVDNPPEKFLEHIMTLLRILGHFIVALLHRRDHVRRLEELCFLDQLTGIGNRRALEKCGSTLLSEKSIGVLYCDVMGLKQMNDTKGHREGDRLLVRASECLRKAFGNYAMFRVGGDEFMVLCEGITEKELEERILLLKKDMEEKDALMALGHVWYQGGRSDVDQLMKEADCRMYEEKRAWYAQNSK